MREIEQIVERLKQAWTGPSWHGPALCKALEGVTAAQAAARPEGGVHSIWELVGHITAWRAAATRGLLERVVAVSDEENFPTPGDPGEEEWRRTLVRLETGGQQLLDCVARLSESDLDRIVHGASEDYSVRFLLNGVANHDLYHAGQIMLIGRQVRQRAS